MLKRIAAISIVTGFRIGLFALAAACVQSRLHAQSADLALCDRLAADPADPDKPAEIPGVAAIAPSDVATAIKYCKTASAKSPRALYELGRAYAANQQVPEAIGAYRKAADRGSTSAMVELGLALASGSGIAKDQDQARALFERAAQAGNPRGVTNMMALGNAGGAPSDPVQARTLLSRAAELNSPDAQFQLGLMLANGIGGPKDDVGARAMFEKAAAQNNPDALDWMGSFAQNGRGGPKDKAAAKAYYERAAALGNEDAKAALKRLECPWTITDKRGTVLTNLCF
jgi:TPR repeat protein